MTKKFPSDLKNIKVFVSKANPSKSIAKINARIGKKASKSSSLDSVKKRYSKKNILKNALSGFK